MILNHTANVIPLLHNTMEELQMTCNKFDDKPNSNKAMKIDKCLPDITQTCMHVITNENI